MISSSTVLNVTAESSINNGRKISTLLCWPRRPVMLSQPLGKAPTPSLEQPSDLGSAILGTNGLFRKRFSLKYVGLSNRCPVI
jgi:hypothetical protein